MNTPLAKPDDSTTKTHGFFSTFSFFFLKKELLGDFGHFLARFENSFASVSMAEAEVSRRPALLRSVWCRCGVALTVIPRHVLKCRIVMVYSLLVFFFGGGEGVATYVRLIEN